MTAIVARRTPSPWHDRAATLAALTAQNDQYDREVFSPLAKREDEFFAQHGAAGKPAAVREAIIAQHGSDCLIPDDIIEKVSSDADLQNDLHDELMRTPAPDLAALLWKLEHLLAVEEGSYTASWRSDYVQPAIEDARRLFGGTKPARRRRLAIWRASLRH